MGRAREFSRSRVLGISALVVCLAGAAIFALPGWAAGADGPYGACSPGFWKNHMESWAPTGYSPDDDFDAVFGTDYFEPDVVLADAAWAHGGGAGRLARHGVAALLNASHPGINYPFTVAEVIASVQAGQTDALAIANEDCACPLP